MQVPKGNNPWTKYRKVAPKVVALGNLKNLEKHVLIKTKWRKNNVFTTHSFNEMTPQITSIPSN